MSDRRFVWVLAVVGGLVAADRSDAGVSYQNPSGGWRYSYDGTFNAPVVDGGFVGGVGPAGYGAVNDTGALDGTWYHDQSDKWDGSAPGDTNGPVASPYLDQRSPGGAAALTEGGTNYIRVQDSGNPESHGFVQANPDPINSNRRVYFGHDMSQDGAFPDPIEGRHGMRVLDNGITISFRMRIPNAGALDDIYPQTGPPLQPWFISPEADYGNNGYVDAADYVLWRNNVQPLPANEVATIGTTDAQDYTEWRARFGNERLGRGYAVHDGRAMITIMQFDGDENGAYGTNGTINFALLTSEDKQNLCAGAPGSTICSGSDSGGLVMNNRSGDSPNNFVNFYDTGQTLNLLPIPDQSLNDWHEFWITIADNGAAAGTHTVNVYMDGSTTPTSFQVTMSGSGNGAYACASCPDAPFQEFGLSSSDLFGAFDMDFYSYKLGVITPVAAGGGGGFGGGSIPEPGTLILVLMAIPGLSVLRFSPHVDRPTMVLEVSTQ